MAAANSAVHRETARPPQGPRRFHRRKRSGRRPPAPGSGTPKCTALSRCTSARCPRTPGRCPGSPAPRGAALHPIVGKGGAAQARLVGEHPRVTPTFIASSQPAAPPAPAPGEKAPENTLATARGGSPGTPTAPPGRRRKTAASWRGPAAQQCAPPRRGRPGPPKRPAAPCPRGEPHRQAQVLQGGGSGPHLDHIPHGQGGQAAAHGVHPGQQAPSRPARRMYPKAPGAPGCLAER